MSDYDVSSKVRATMQELLVIAKEPGRKANKLESMAKVLFQGIQDVAENSPVVSIGLKARAELSKKLDKTSGKIKQAVRFSGLGGATKKVAREAAQFSKNPVETLKSVPNNIIGAVNKTFPKELNVPPELKSDTGDIEEMLGSTVGDYGVGDNGIVKIFQKDVPRIDFSFNGTSYTQADSIHGSLVRNLGEDGAKNLEMVAHQGLLSPCSAAAMMATNKVGSGNDRAKIDIRISPDGNKVEIVAQCKLELRDIENPKNSPESVFVHRTISVSVEDLRSGNLTSLKSNITITQKRI